MSEKALGISFGLTVGQLLLGQKTVTRRVWKERHANHFIRYANEGKQAIAYDKSPRIGGRQVGWLSFTCVPYSEKLSEMPIEDLSAEGFPDYSKDQFIDEFFEGKPNQVVWVVRFKFFPLEEAQTAQEAISAEATTAPEPAAIAPETGGTSPAPQGGYALTCRELDNERIILDLNVRDWARGWGLLSRIRVTGGGSLFNLAEAELTVESDGVTCRITDSSTYAKVAFKGEIGLREPIKFRMAAGLLKAIFDKLIGLAISVEIPLDLVSQDDPCVKLAFPGGEYNLKVSISDDYPKQPRLENPLGSISLPYSSVVAIAQRCAYAASGDRGSYFNSILWVGNSDGKLTAIATDKCRIAAIEGIECSEASPGRIAIPLPFYSLINSLPVESSALLRLTWDATRLQVDCEGCSLIGYQCNGDYPDAITNILSQFPSDVEATLDKNQAADAILCTTYVCWQDKDFLTTDFSEGGVTFRASSAVGESCTSIDAEVKGSERLAFKDTFLTSAIASLGDTIQVGATQKNQPVYFKSQTDIGTLKAVVMPILIRE